MQARTAMVAIPGLLAAVLALCLGAGGTPAADQGTAEKEHRAVERAVLDYCEAFYDIKPELLERSLHPELHKFGFYRESADQEYRKVTSSYDGLVQLAKVWNKEGRFGKDALKKVEVLDVLDKIACAKLIGAWGIDYVHLAKYDGKWMIEQVIWQSHPMSSAQP